MARQSSRRPGHNRRAQYGLFASYLVTVLSALIGLFLVIISMADPVGFGIIRSGLAEISRPVALTLKQVVSGVSSADEIIAAYINAGTQNIALRRQVERDRPLLIEAQAIRQENDHLKKLLYLVDTTEGTVATGRMISSNATTARRIARISVGRMQGVLPGMPVRAPEGLIGRVLISGPNTSEVLLLTDSQNIIPVLRANDNLAAICTGMDDGTVEIKPLGVGNNPFRPGDILVTSGIGGVYGANIPVAIVVEQRYGVAIGLPLANPARVNAVAVQRPFDVAAPPAPPEEGNQAK